MTEPNRDSLDGMRFLDGEMHDVERTRFVRRLEREPELQQLVEELQGDRSWFQPERERAEPAPQGMVAGVLARPRRGAGCPGDR